MYRTISLLILVLAIPGTDAQAVRSLATDRPDRTESAYTAPRGWLQVEADAVSHGEFETGNATFSATSVASFNVKYGVTRRLDVQAVFSPWVRLRAEAPGVDDTDDGTGQAGTRVKFNLTGNDGGDVAAAVLPFAFVPTRGDDVFDRVTYGVVTPVAVALGSGRSVGSMLGVMNVENDDWWMIGSVSLATPVAGSVSGFVELYVARAGFESDASEDVTADAGLTYALSPDWQLDGGVYYGLTDTTEDWRVFAGASARFPLSR